MMAKHTGRHRLLGAWRLDCQQPYEGVQPVSVVTMKWTSLVSLSLQNIHDITLACLCAYGILASRSLNFKECTSMHTNSNCDFQVPQATITLKEKGPQALHSFLAVRTAYTAYMLTLMPSSIHFDAYMRYLMDPVTGREKLTGLSRLGFRRASRFFLPSAYRRGRYDAYISKTRSLKYI
ncbi:hypothetical protein CPC08DRAFT_144888 [Agrocybe pediades]|nr:hypothetical protein CPC08DRAFT_144888 [Agrocybe pediades]